MSFALMLLILALFISWINGGVVNPPVITLFLLALSCGLSSLHLFGLYDFDPIAFKIIAIGGAAVFAGAALTAFSSTKGSALARKAVRESQEPLVRFRSLSIVLIVCTVLILVRRWPILVNFAKGGDLASVRSSYLGYGQAEAVISLSDRLIIGPVITLALPIFLWAVLRRQAPPLFITTFTITVALNTITTGGRFFFLYAGIMVLALIAHSGVLDLRTKGARFMLIMLLLIVAGVTLARGNSILFEAYTYFAIPVPLLAHWAAAIDEMGLQTFGSSFAYGALTLLFRFSEMVGVPLGADISYAVAVPQDSWVELLPNRPFNAFVTLFYFFYLDFRWVGVIGGGFVWGIIGQLSFMRMWSSGLRWTIFGLLMLQVAVMSFARWELTNGSLVLAILMIPFFIGPSSSEPHHPRKLMRTNPLLKLNSSQAMN